MSAGGPSPVLVLGTDTRMLLSIVRSLAEGGIPAEVAGCDPSEPALSSRWVRRRHDLPACEDGGAAWRTALAECLRGGDFSLVIPATEDAVFPLQTHRTQLEGLAPLYVLDEYAFDATSNKQKTYALARSLGIPVPGTWVVAPRGVSSALLAALPSPAVLKPCSSLRQADLSKAFVRPCANREQLRVALDELGPGTHEVLVQEYCPGHGVGLDVLALEGEILFAFQHRRLHETSGFGGTYRQSEPLDPELVEAASRLVEALGYTGVAMVEFRVDPTSGRWVLIEINARFWGSLPLAVHAGAHFPLFLYQLLVDGRRDFDPAYRVGLRCRYLSNDLRWLWRWLRQRIGSPAADQTRIGWSINEVSAPRLLADVGRMLAGLDASDTFAWRDPLPWLAELRQLVQTARGVRR